MTNRNCGSCRHFQKIDGTSTGHCTNPLVVSHQGGLVMYREAEIGCRRGWKQDLWEARTTADEADQELAEKLAASIDRSRAEAWADLPPSQREEPADLLADTHGFSDDDLLDPRGTRDIREAIRRAREAKRRELQQLTRREPQDRPILSSEQRSGEDTVLDVRPLPLERAPDPIVPPVSVDEIRKRVDDMRRQRRVFEPPPPVHFRDDDERYTRLPDPPLPGTRFEPGVDAMGETASANVDAEAPPSNEARPAGPGGESAGAAVPRLPAPERSLPVSDRPFEPEAPEVTVEAAEGWPEQAPWAQEEPLYEEWIEQRPRRRSWFGSLLHRHQAPPPQPPVDPLLAWEPDADDGTGDELEPWNAEADTIAAAPEPGVPGPAERPGEPVLPPLPYDADDDLGEDYLLADTHYGEGEEDEQAATQVPRICATCRYFRPDGTCGNSFAFTFRRRVNEDYLSCASSIGSWWLPSDRYWESVVDFAHHGQPTPLLDRFARRSDEQESDDEMHTP